MGPCSLVRSGEGMEESTSIFTFSNCNCQHELNEKNENLQKQFYQSHLEIKKKLIENLETIIDEQEGRIEELRKVFKTATGRCSPLILSETKMLKGISHLSVDFGELSDENFQLKQELKEARLENRRLQLRLNSTVTNYAELPLLMDNETQTEKFKKYKIIENENFLEDTEDFVDDTASETTVSSGIQCDSETRPNSIEDQFFQENINLKKEISNLKMIENQFFEIKESYSKLVQRHEEEVSLRKALHDALVQLRGNIRVFCRIRPSEDLQKSLEKDILDPDAVTVNSDSGIKRFLFDRVFGESANQMDIFNEVEDIVLSCLDGMNVCIFAYGQTGSGKTHTMDGPEEDPGIGHRALLRIFEFKNSKKDQTIFSINISFIEIYNEKIKDLLNQKNQKLEIKLDKNGRQIISNLSKHQVDSIDKVKNILFFGRKNRSTAATALNDHSSRSHAVLIVEITMIDKASGNKSIGKLNLIDLAGSERIAKSQVTGPQLKETQFINKSLSELGNVVAALRKKQQHIPFRNCQLTRILEDSLDGDSKTLMIVQVAAERSFIQESISSLNFAEKISGVTRRTPKNPPKKP